MIHTLVAIVLKTELIIKIVILLISYDNLIICMVHVLNMYKPHHFMRLTLKMAILYFNMMSYFK